MLLLSADRVIASEQPLQIERVQRQSVRLGRKPRLDVVLVGDNPASQIYVKNKAKKGALLGLHVELHLLSPQQTRMEFKAALSRICTSPESDAVLLQRPVPHFLDGALSEEEIALAIPPSKDVDGFHPENQGRVASGLTGGFAPCTPAGIIRLLEFYGVNLVGKTAVVVGRSTIVGRPMAQLLLQKDATVIQVHSRTPHPERWLQLADIAVIAAGRPKLFVSSQFKKDAIVIDVGIHRDPVSGVVFGDVDATDAGSHLGGLSPVPGGVGPMTIHCLFENVILAAEAL